MFQQRRGLSAGQIQWLGRIGLVVSFTIAAFILTRTNAPSNDRAGVDPIREDRLVSRSRSAVGPTGDPKAGTRAIETLQVGDRVLAQNPEVSQAERDGFGEPNWDNWLQLSLAMPKGDGSLLEIELLRPEAWVREQLGMVVEPLPSGIPPALAPSLPTAAQHVDAVAYSPLLPILRDVALAGAELQLAGEELRAIFGANKALSLSD